MCVCSSVIWDVPHSFSLFHSVIAFHGLQAFKQFMFCSCFAGMIIIYLFLYCVTCPYTTFAFLQAPSLLLHTHSAILATNFYSQYIEEKPTANLCSNLSPEQHLLISRFWSRVSRIWARFEEIADSSCKDYRQNRYLFGNYQVDLQIIRVYLWRIESRKSSRRTKPLPYMGSEITYSFGRAREWDEKWHSLKIYCNQLICK